MSSELAMILVAVLFSALLVMSAIFLAAQPRDIGTDKLMLGFGMFVLGVVVGYWGDIFVSWGRL